MKFSFSIQRWYALSSGLSNVSDWITWSYSGDHDWTQPIPKLVKTPMMQARRMSIPSRLAVEVGLNLIEETQVDFAIFICRYGELERTYKILNTLNSDEDISPTDFALSVHNTASGLLTIIAKQEIPMTSISAYQDGFQQGLLEAQSLLKLGYERILLIDFDGVVPDVYHTQIHSFSPVYAVGMIITKGTELSVQSTNNPSTDNTNYPQSLSFLHNYLSKQKTFTLQGNLHNWQWAIEN